MSIHEDCERMLKEKDNRIHTLEGEIRVVFPQMVAERDKAKERIKELEQERERMLSDATVEKIIRQSEIYYMDCQASREIGEGSEDKIKKRWAKEIRKILEGK